MGGCSAGHDDDYEEEDEHVYSPRLSHDLASSWLIERTSLVVKTQLDNSGLVSHLRGLVGGYHVEVCSLMIDSL